MRRLYGIFNVCACRVAESTLQFVDPPMWFTLYRSLCICIQSPTLERVFHSDSSFVTCGGICVFFVFVNDIVDYCVFCFLSCRHPLIILIHSTAHVMSRSCLVNCRGGQLWWEHGSRLVWRPPTSVCPCSQHCMYCGTRKVVPSPSVPSCLWSVALGMILWNTYCTNFTLISVVVLFLSWCEWFEMFWLLMLNVLWFWLTYNIDCHCFAASVRCIDICEPMNALCWLLCLWCYELMKLQVLPSRTLLLLRHPPSTPYPPSTSFVTTSQNSSDPAPNFAASINSAPHPSFPLMLCTCSAVTVESPSGVPNMLLIMCCVCVIMSNCVMFHVLINFVIRTNLCSLYVVIWKKNMWI